ncbi:MAG: hypothetical protein BWX55_01553 [Deltaproteobacteria bacterium ADurb.Bin022]|nr:MAG: hypothetical protein BWX55_01553 [Deltaproteobacteria bacterium ADurb.Bin022]
MRNGVGVPALGQHGNRNNAADRIAQAVFFADRIHDFPKQVLVGQILRLAAVASALNNFTAIAFNFFFGHCSKIVIQCFTRFQLLAVNQERSWPGQRVAVFIVIGKQGEFAQIRRGRHAVFFRWILKAGYIVIDQFGRGCIVADDNKTRRQLHAAFFPEVIRFLVVAVKGLQSGLKTCRKFQRVKSGSLAPALFGHVLADMFPQVPKHRHIAARDIISYRNTR